MEKILTKTCSTWNNLDAKIAILRHLEANVTMTFSTYGGDYLLGQIFYQETMFHKKRIFHKICSTWKTIATSLVRTRGFVRLLKIFHVEHSGLA